MDAKILKEVKGVPATDGAGVKLTRVLGYNDIESHDPFLMLDSFDSTNYDDYKAGFPTHPHRGIETITYLSQGSVTHKDSMGNKKTISDGMIQWMTAGSGVMHSEMFEDQDRLLGLQLWLDLPKEEKMSQPNYKEVSVDEVIHIPEGEGEIRLMSGEYKGHEGYQSPHNPLDYYAIDLGAGKTIELETKEGYTTHIFTLVGNVKVNDRDIRVKTDVLLGEGTVRITAQEDAEIVWMASPPIGDPVAWHGPIVMNTQEELVTAFQELRNGTFIKDKIEEID